MTGARGGPTPPTGRGVLYAGARDISVVSRPVGEPAAGEMLVEIAFCGVCGSDVAEYRHGPLLAHVASEPHRVTGHRGPVVLGHELSGHVGSAGEGVEHPLGTLVACAGSASCGRCPACRRGETNLCPDYHIVGMHRDGGLAMYCLVPARACVDASAYNVPPSVAALAQPMAIAVHALARADVCSGERVAIIGIGGVGAFLLYATAEAGGRLTAIDPDPARLSLARGLGADRTFTHAGPAAGVEDDPRHDVVFEVSGTEAGLRTAVAAARPGGRVVLVGLQSPEAQLGASDLVLGEQTILGSFAQSTVRDLPEALRVLASRAEGWRDVAPTAFPLDDVVTRGLEPTGGGIVKTLFAPWLSASCDVTHADELSMSTHPAPLRR